MITYTEHSGRFLRWPSGPHMSQTPNTDSFKIEISSVFLGARGGMYRMQASGEFYHQGPCTQLSHELQCKLHEGVHIRD